MRSKKNDAIDEIDFEKKKYEYTAYEDILRARNSAFIISAFDEFFLFRFKYE